MLGLEFRVKMPPKGLLAFQCFLYIAELALHEEGLHYGENTGKSV